MPKKSIRQLLLARRRALPPAEASAAGSLIQRTLIATREFAEARLVALYAPIHNEVETEEVAHAALAAGKQVLFPAVSGNRLDFRQVADPRQQLHKGAYGILEPDATSPARLPEEAGLVIVPGVAFDVNGRRIGYGKGYYDQALHHLEGKGRLVAFCYDFQIVAEIPAEPHDVRMDMIITELRVIRPRY